MYRYVRVTPQGTHRKCWAVDGPSGPRLMPGRGAPSVLTAPAGLTGADWFRQDAGYFATVTAMPLGAQ